MPRVAARALSAALPALAVGVASAHGADVGGGGWSVDPYIAPAMLVSLLLQCIGLARMGAAARSRIAPPRRALAYALAQATLVIALFSPLDARADDSFAWHMAQHLLLMLVAAPLFAMSNMHHVAMFALPMTGRRGIGRITGALPGGRRGGTSRAAPWLAALAFTVGLWAWHAPALYEAALEHRAVHTAEHLVFLVTSGFFWRTVATSGDRRLSPAAAIVLVSLVGLQGGLMAALITLAPRPLYAHYAATAGVGDQQIAGLLMWVPASFIYLASTVLALRRMMSTTSRPDVTTVRRAFR
ncbi:cytochrome c oxidase assembly protein [Cognatilysobacter lacus]|uniref:Cytochrome c oxidase assembly protein n=1 Tax=Cognatilysobacter lacus TaxID=1643323 RepID=A0A5D8Z9L1_9GAMM|nr:cytochrome c oxidase assembly protein [Lysobacter lacus]TZF90802.1 cytochrome c oxidase assembly protein [Lysobacter lacus]